MKIDKRKEEAEEEKKKKQFTIRYVCKTVVFEEYFPIKR